MIRLIDDAHVFENLRCDNLFEAKICSIYKTYGFTRFTDFWQGDDGTLIARLDNTFIISAQNNSEELSSFIEIICCGKVTCNENIHLSSISYNSGAIMEYVGADVTTQKTKLEIIEDLHPREVYSLLSSCFQMGDYDSFCADFLHRTNKKTIMSVGAYYRGRLISCAFAMLANSSAIIYSVAVDSAYRRQGIGTVVVTQLINRLKGHKHIFLQRADGENECFYKNMGFINIGKWKEITGDR